jgi:hypothetical protein
LKQDRRASFPWPLLALAVPVLYLASVGPVARVLDEVPPPDWLGTVLGYVYYPVSWGYRNSELFRTLLEAYLRVWGTQP